MLKKIIFSALMVVSSASVASEYPNKAVKAIVPFHPGGTTDVVARLVGERIAPLFGQPLIVENHSGASGSIGTKIAADAKADGYTIIFGNNQTHSTNASLFSNLPYDLRADFTPIAMLTRTKHVLVVPTSSSIQSLDDLIEQGQNGILNFASSSMGSSAHLLSESMGNKLGMEVNHIPYRGAAPAIIDTIAGHVDFTVASYGSAVSYLKDGTLRPLAISGEERDSDLPDVPTFSELGLDSLSVDSWIGVYAPAGTPDEIIVQWSNALTDIMEDDDIIQKLKRTGFEVWFKDSEEMATFHPEEIDRWAELVNEVGVKLD